jgi:hypothetical protein
MGEHSVTTRACRAEEIDVGAYTLLTIGLEPGDGRGKPDLTIHLATNDVASGPRDPHRLEVWLLEDAAPGEVSELLSAALLGTVPVNQGVSRTWQWRSTSPRDNVLHFVVYRPLASWSARNADYDLAIWSTLPDRDGDGVHDEIDNCPQTANVDQRDGDHDRLGDACDRCPGVVGFSNRDGDGDGRPDDCDNCPQRANVDQVDADRDGRVDGCDNCPSLANRDQFDRDGDEIGDACDPDHRAIYGGVDLALTRIAFPSTTWDDTGDPARTPGVALTFQNQGARVLPRTQVRLRIEIQDAASLPGFVARREVWQTIDTGTTMRFRDRRTIGIPWSVLAPTRFERRPVLGRAGGVVRYELGKLEWPPGRYIFVLDADQQVSETDESNNLCILLDPSPPPGGAAETGCTPEL